MVNNAKTAQKIVKNMSLGDKSAILKGLSHKGALVRMNSIAFAVSFRCTDESIIREIRKLKKDDAFVMGYFVSQFAISALHVLGIEAYEGNDEKIIEIIESEFIF